MERLGSWNWESNSRELDTMLSGYDSQNTPAASLNTAGMQQIWVAVEMAALASEYQTIEAKFCLSPLEPSLSLRATI